MANSGEAPWFQGYYGFELSAALIVQYTDHPEGLSRHYVARTPEEACRQHEIIMRRFLYLSLGLESGNPMEYFYEHRQQRRHRQGTSFLIQSQHRQYHPPTTEHLGGLQLLPQQQLRFVPPPAVASIHREYRQPTISSSTEHLGGFQLLPQQQPRFVPPPAVESIHREYRQPTTSVRPTISSSTGHLGGLQLLPQQQLRFVPPPAVASMHRGYYQPTTSVRPATAAATRHPESSLSLLQRPQQLPRHVHSLCPAVMPKRCFCKFCCQSGK